MRRLFGHVQRRDQDQQGAVALMVALLATSLIITGALVLDMGLARLTRQVNKSALDAAAVSSLEAMKHLDEFGNETGKAAPYPAVCAALEYLKANRPDLASVTGMLKDGLGSEQGNCPLPEGSPLKTVACNPDDRTTWAWFSGTTDGGRFQVDIKNGYVPSEDADAFPEENWGSLVNDQGAPEHKGCDQLAVIVTDTDDTSLGGLAGVDDMSSSVRSVARVDMGEDNSEVVALVTLEREDCQALTTNGVTSKIFVDGYLDTPGMMHADSLGNGDDCIPKKVIAVDGNNVGAIVAGDSDNGHPGVIGMVALNGGAGAVATNATDPIPKVYTEPYPPGGAPDGHDLVTRSPVDKDYFTGVKAAISLANSTWALGAAAAADPATDWVVPATRCSGNNLPLADARNATETVYFDCPGGVAYSGSVDLAAKTVIFPGNLKVSPGNHFNMPNASKVYINGITGRPGLDVSGAFRMNTQGAATCATNSPSARGRLVIGTGRIDASGSSSDPDRPVLFQVCDTAVVMLGGQANGCVPDDFGLEPQEITACTSGYIDLTGGASTDWTAPNLRGADRLRQDLEDLEDLAFWTESENMSRIRGNGGITLSGVFVLPNANPFSVGGSGTQNVEDSQYFTRKLESAGGGRLYMRPNPDNVTKVPYYGSYRLVR